MIHPLFLPIITRTTIRGRSTYWITPHAPNFALKAASPPFPFPIFLLRLIAPKWTILSAAIFRAAGYLRLLRESQARRGCHPSCEKPATHVLCPRFDAPRRSHPVHDAQNEGSYANILSRSGRDANAIPQSQHFSEASIAMASMPPPPQGQMVT